MYEPQTMLEHIVDAQHRCGITEWYNSDMQKPARQGVYRVKALYLYKTGHIMDIRWAWFGLDTGWHWPTLYISTAPARMPILSPEARVLLWQGLASDPNA